MADDNPTLVVHHHEPMKHELQLVASQEPKESELSVRVDAFGLTSNNVTYAALGKQLHYFEFFPVQGPWSALPVWGVGTVTASRAAGIGEGARLYGYFPAAQATTLRVSGTTPNGFRVDRPNLPPEHALYGQYALLDRDPLYLADREELMTVMRPLFLTGLLLADYLTVSQCLGAEAVLISSAASKTSYGLAHALRAAGQTQVLGLASARSADRARTLACYDRVFDYDELSALDPARSVVYVDVAGSTPLRTSLAARLGGALRGIISVGLTHWQEGGFGGDAQLGVPVETFFAPGWAARRQKEAGMQFLAQLRAGWLAQMESATQHFKLVRQHGGAALSQAFAALVAGRIDPGEAWLHAL
jgi:NADPH:quinone reductase-like Zn-dependent oxidoreductase